MEIRKRPKYAIAFLQGKFPGATFPNGQRAQVRAVFGGDAPAPLAGRPNRPSRLILIDKPLTHKAITLLWMLRGGKNSASFVDEVCFGRAISPKQEESCVSKLPRPALCIASRVS